MKASRLPTIFNTMINALKNEDRYLLKYADPEECGISNLDEKHIQYILYRSLLKLPGFNVYIEAPYGKGNRKCDLFIYKNGSKSIWIEIKTAGWCWEADYKKWVQADSKKMRGLKQSQKYLLVTSVEKEKSEASEWADYFKKELVGIRFAPELFGFFRTKFMDRKIPQNGYYTICLLKVL
jgi:hypothetical protein